MLSITLGEGLLHFASIIHRNELAQTSRTSLPSLERLRSSHIATGMFMTSVAIPKQFQILFWSTLAVYTAAVIIDHFSGLVQVTLLYALVTIAHITIALFLIPARACLPRNTPLDLTHSFGTWFDHYFKFMGQFRLWGFRIGSAFAPFMPGLLLFLCGWLVALTYNFSNVYLRSIPVYLGAFGVSWVTFVLYWIKRNLTRRVIEIQPCFVMDSADFYSLVERWFSRFTDPRWLYAFISAMATLTTFLAYVSLHFGPIEGKLPMKSLRPSLFPTEWYEGNIGLNLLIVDLFAIVCCVPLATAMWLLIINIGFLHELGQIKPIPVPQLLVTRFRGITSTYLWVTFTWFIGVALFAILLFSEPDVFSITVVLGLSALGLISFGYPQMIFHNHIIRAYNDLSEGVSIVYRLAFRNQTFQEVAVRIADEKDEDATDADVRSLADMVQLLSAGPLWVFDLRDAAVLLLGQAAALVGILAQSFFRD